MGPFPHDAPPPAISDQNPMGTDGFEFVEFCHPRPDELDRLFRVMGFAAVAKHRSKNSRFTGKATSILFSMRSRDRSQQDLLRSMVLQHPRWHFAWLMRNGLRARDHTWRQAGQDSHRSE